MIPPPRPSRRSRRRLRGLVTPLAASLLLLGGSAIAAAGPQAPRAPRAPRAPDARVSAQFVMHGRITSAVRVRGERRGQGVTRQWTFVGIGCGPISCPALSLTRERSDGQLNRTTLGRTGPGTYAGGGRFFVALSCLGQTYPRGLIVPYRITVRILATAIVQGLRFATKLQATYTNPARHDRTICPLGPSHDAAAYSGLATPLPTPPVAGFSASVDPATDQATFSDRSTPGAGNAPVTGWAWQFGDPGSGAADTASTPDPTHGFSAPGAYTVTLTVTDANGLTSTSTQQVLVPGPAP